MQSKQAAVLLTVFDVLVGAKAVSNKAVDKVDAHRWVDLRQGTHVLRSPEARAADGELDVL
jgi:hypothetical protein